MRSPLARTWRILLQYVYAGAFLLVFHPLLAISPPSFIAAQLCLAETFVVTLSMETCLSKFQNQRLSCAKESDTLYRNAFGRVEFNSPWRDD